MKIFLEKAKSTVQLKVTQAAQTLVPDLVGFPEPAVKSPPKGVLLYKINNSLSKQRMLIIGLSTLFVPDPRESTGFRLVGGDATREKLKALVHVNNISLCLVTLLSKEDERKVQALLVKEGLAGGTDEPLIKSISRIEEMTHVNWDESVLDKAKKIAQKHNKKGDNAFFLIHHQQTCIDAAHEIDRAIDSYKLDYSKAGDPDTRATQLGQALDGVVNFFYPLTDTESDELLSLPQLQEQITPSTRPPALPLQLSSQKRAALAPSGHTDALSITQPIPESLTLKEWLTRHFFDPPLLQYGQAWKKWTLKSFKNSLASAFLHIYGFDGYESTAGEIIYADDSRLVISDKRYRGEQINKWLLFWAFIGAPSRPIVSDYTQQQISPALPWRQFIKNFFGGLDWNAQTPRDKKTLHLLGLPFKLLLIFPLKVITLPFKTLINVVKIVTELLPWVLTIASSVAFLRLVVLTQSLYAQAFLAFNVTKNSCDNDWWLPSWWEQFFAVTATIIAWLIMPIFAELVLMSCALYALVSWAPKIQKIIVSALKTAAISLIVPLVAVLVAVSFVMNMLFRILAVLGRIITSPEKSMRMAYANGKALKITSFGPGAERVLRVVFGLLGGLISLALSITIWTVGFSLAVGIITSAFPTLLVGATSALQLPVIATVVSWVNIAVAAITPLFVQVFVPGIAAISSYLGVHVTTAAIVGFTIATVGIPMSWVADKLSNRWASWREGDVFPRWVHRASTVDGKAVGQESSASEKYEIDFDKGIIREKGAVQEKPEERVTSSPTHDRVLDQWLDPNFRRNRESFGRADGERPQQAQQLQQFGSWNSSPAQRPRVAIGGRQQQPVDQVESDWSSFNK